MRDDTTRLEFIEQLKVGAATGNQAIKRHLEQVERMTDGEWVNHRKYLIEAGRAFKPTAERLAREMIHKLHRDRRG